MLRLFSSCGQDNKKMANEFKVKIQVLVIQEVLSSGYANIFIAVVQLFEIPTQSS